MEPMKNWEYFFWKTEPFPESITLTREELELLLLHSQLKALVRFIPTYTEAWGKETSSSRSNRGTYRSRVSRILGRIKELNPSIHEQICERYDLAETIRFCKNPQ